MKRVLRSSLNVPKDFEIIRCMFADTSSRSDIFASISTKEITKNMVRAKSSNIWSYAINVRNAKDSTGDMYIQFKGRDGGPDDIYMYFDVPIRVYRRFVTATSKGHFFGSIFETIISIENLQVIREENYQMQSIK